MKKNILFLAVLVFSFTALMMGHAVNGMLIHYKVQAANKNAPGKIVCSNKDHISTTNHLVRVEPVFQQSFHEKRHKRILEVTEYLSPVATWSFTKYTILQRDFFSGTRNYQDLRINYHLPQRAPPVC
jgi:hypothetical protein